MMNNVSAPEINIDVITQKNHKQNICKIYVHRTFFVGCLSYYLNTSSLNIHKVNTYITVHISLTVHLSA